MDLTSPLDLNSLTAFRRVSSVVLVLAVAFVVTACGGGDDDIHANESEATRAIRMKVKEKMERERLERVGSIIAHSAQASAAAATATSVGDLPEGAIELASASSSEDAAASNEPVGEDRAKELYAANCASCHGASGAGDGLLSAGLNPKPAKHSDGNYMNPLSDDHLFKVVKEGGTAVGKSGLMAPWGGSMSDAEIHALVAFMRTLADPPYTGS